MLNVLFSRFAERRGADFAVTETGDHPMPTINDPTTSPQDQADYPQQPAPISRQRGRRSAASLSVVPPNVMMRPSAPPNRLSAAEKKIWEETVSRVRPTWFHSSEALLELFVVTLAQQQQIAVAIRGSKTASRRWMTLVRMHLALTQSASNLATKLRLTPRSSIDRKTPKLVPSPGARPWDDDAS